MEKTLQDLTRQLLALSKSAAEEKVLPQEIRLIQEKAFAVQEQMMELLQEQEETTNDVREVQNIFQIREDVWDIMNNLAIREAEIKAKFGIKGESPKAEHTCCHHHHEDKCCCKHHHEEGCCHKENKKKCCQKEKKHAAKNNI
ncbi:MAG: hypothetical protein II938_02415 [Alphaproteobacteria bacterium]|nr:hypothetical protein [Alphaproteobacteria bacterium]